jgi:hypothetical protein
MLCDVNNLLQTVFCTCEMCKEGIEAYGSSFESVPITRSFTVVMGYSMLPVMSVITPQFEKCLRGFLNVVSF